MAVLFSKLNIGKITQWLHKQASLKAEFPAASVSAYAVAERYSTLAAKKQIEDKGRTRLSGVLLYIPGVLTFGLGTWQLFRRQEKIELLEHRQKQLEQDPVPLIRVFSKTPNSSPNAEALTSLEFRKVTCEGVYDEKKSIFIGPRSRTVSGITENGYYMVTPLYLVADDGSAQPAVLVNRGWVPRNWRDKFFDSLSTITSRQNVISTEEAKPVTGSWWRFWSKKQTVPKESNAKCETVKVVGVIRGSEHPTIFMPPNDPESGQWFHVDIPAMTQTAGLPENTVYVEEIESQHSPSNPYPVPKDVKTFVRYSVMPQDHLNYALTWYSLSAATTFMAAKRLKKK
eukprot:TRINITY_DN17506_c0_g2_i1.p1 TRINITY_DN17506_c0_g2~~TRINITY_DN17506_c0_g2_i1.p1  ORF type:complete len:342 (+),score=45.15 TRINITY_DN17506_c0_g2_i1:189-1214(+)